MLSVCLSLILSVSLDAGLPHTLTAHVFVSITFYLSAFVSLAVCLLCFLSIGVLVSITLCLSVSFTLCLSVCVLVSLALCLSVSFALSPFVCLSCSLTLCLYMYLYLSHSVCQCIWLFPSLSLSLSIYIYIYHHHHHHHVAPPARISLTLSRHFSLSFIASGRSSGLHPVSSHSCCMYVRAGRPALAHPYVGVHRSTSLMSSSLLLQQCSACLVRRTCIVFVMGGQVSV